MRDPTGFFAHHGALAPGIRLFRRIGFAAKAACVSAAFLLPLAVACWALWTTASANIEFSAKERLGTEYARPALELIEAAQSRRRAATNRDADLQATDAPVAAAFERLAAVQRRHGDALGTGGAFDALAARHRGLAGAPVAATPEATFDAHSAYVAAAIALLRDATDGSNLTLDPDLDTYYMMDATLMQTPDLVDGLGLLRTHGTAALRDGRASGPRRDALVVALAASGVNAKRLRVAIARADAARPGLAASLPAESAARATDALLKAAREHVLDGAPGLGADAYRRLADEAVAGQYRLARAVLDALDAALDERIAKLQRTLALQLGLAAAGVALAFYLFLSFYLVTRGGLANVARHLEQVAAGDLTGVPRPWGSDEAASLMRVLGRTIESLRTTVVQVRTAAGEVETASGEIASAAQDLSTRTEQTAAGLQRTASEVQAIAGSVRETAGDAGGAATIVDENAEAARRGAEVVREATSTMDEIRAASQRIADIIGTIDGIAFQTNILALNAAVEAARAGEQGRGFAVVASEVRALAQRTTTAAREVKALIEGNGERVATGARVIGSAGRAMLDIVDNAERIHGLIRRISAATADQTQGIGNVERAVRELDSTTHQNAALVEQSAATAATLHQSAARLSREMASFRTD
jgi:methyl-accepting chemotaxis protein